MRKFRIKSRMTVELVITVEKIITPLLFLYLLLIYGLIGSNNNVPNNDSVAKETIKNGKPIVLAI